MYICRYVTCRYQKAEEVYKAMKTVVEERNTVANGARLQQLEMMQMQQAGQNQAQPQVIIAQPQAAPAQQ